MKIKLNDILFGRGSDFWEGRTDYFSVSLFNALNYLANKNSKIKELNKETELDIGLLREYFVFENAEKLSRDEDIPEKYRQGLIQFFDGLPAYTYPLSEIKEEARKIKFYNQYRYILMKITEKVNKLEKSS